MAESDRWNHNIHHHRLVLEAVPTGARRALDVGCGEGMLTRDLHRTIPTVVGIDLDPPSIGLAKQQPAPGLEFLLGDVLTYPFEPASFDLIASVAVLHHLDAAVGLARMVELLRPGGTLVVIGLARSRPRDLPVDALGAVASRAHRLTKGYWEHSAPIVWPPPATYAEMRGLATDALPGVRYRRHILWRYSLVWVKPA